MQKPRIRVGKYLICALSVAFMVSCDFFKEKPNEQRIFSNDLESRDYSSNWKNLGLRMEGSAHSGIYFLRAYRKQPLGIGYETEIPGFVKNRNFALGIEFYYRQQKVDSKAKLLVTVTKADTLIFRDTFLVSNSLAVNRWVLFQARINFPASIPPDAQLSASLHNSGESFTDFDDYKISFNKIGRPSFLITDTKKPNPSFWDGFSFRPVYKNKFFTVAYSDKLGDLQIRSTKKDKIFSSVKYYLQWKKGSDTLHAYADKLIFNVGEKNELVLTGSTGISNFTLKLKVDDTSPLIKAETKSVYKDSIQLLREALIFSYSPDLAEVYRKNSLLEDKRFRYEYWLDKGGLKIGTGINTAYIYHNTEISSVQLSTRLKEVTFNLDYCRDHPMEQVVINSQSGKQIKDLSCSRFKANVGRENSFQLFVGFDIGSLPRLMKSPHGYLSTIALAKGEGSYQANLANGNGNSASYLRNNYLSESSKYNFYGHFMIPYPGFGDFFPTPNFWKNNTAAPEDYVWRLRHFENTNQHLETIFTVQRLDDFVSNRGIIFIDTTLSLFSERSDSILNSDTRYEKVTRLLAGYQKQRQVNLTTSKALMDYWLALENVKIRLMPDGKYKIYNSSYQTINGLSLAIKADSVFVNDRPPEHSFRDKNGDIIVWFDLRGQQSRIISTK